MSRNRSVRSGFIAVAVVSAVLAPTVRHSPPQPLRRPSATESRARAVQSFGKLPVRFEANEGQTDPSVAFTARSPEATVFLTRDEAVLSMEQPNRKSTGATPGRATPSTPPPALPARDIVRMRPLDATPSAVPEATDRLPGVSNYLVGNDPAKWRTGVSGYGGVRYRGVYPGIDLVYHGTQGALEYDFVVAPGADPARIALGFEGADRISLDERGDLVLAVGGRDVVQRRPVLYQEVNGDRRRVDGDFVVGAGDRVTFRVGPYDRTIPLVIDPVIAYSAFLGGSFDDAGVEVDVDPSGSAYLTGSTNSLDFPTTTGSVQPASPTPNGTVFVAKLAPDGNSLAYATYLGGNQVEYPGGIAVDAGGHAYVVGYTASSNFPTTPNALLPACVQNTFGCSGDVFLAKLAPNGSTLAYSTYLGGTDGSDHVGDVDVDVDGDAYVGGSTNSVDFPLSENAFDRTCGLDGTCSRNQHFTGGSSTAGSPIYTYTAKYFNNNFLGKTITGDNIPPGTTIVEIVQPPGVPSYEQSDTVRLSNNATATGSNLTFTVVDLNQPSQDAFLTRIRTTASGAASLVYSSYLGGERYDSGTGVAVDPKSSWGGVYLTGRTGGRGFPTSSGAFDRLCGRELEARPCSDSYLAKFNTGPFFSPEDTLLTGPDSFSTFLGGTTGSTEANAVAADVNGNAVVTGRTESPSFPTRNAVQPELAGTDQFRTDAFVTKVTSDGGALIYSTYLGGAASYDQGNDIVADGAGNTYVVGFTNSADFPTKGAVQGYGGSGDGFVTKLSPSGSAIVYSTFLGGSSGDGVDGVSVDPSGAPGVYVTGSTSASDFPAVAAGVRAGSRGGTNAFVLKLVAGDTPLVAGLSPRGGPTSGGTPVVITGERFSGASAVRFGGVPALSFTVQSDSRIVAVSPPHAEGSITELTTYVTVVGPQAPSVEGASARFVYGEGVFHATGSCVGPWGCPVANQAVTLQSGKVLFMNGAGTRFINDVIPASSQLFDPLTGTWSATGACAGCGWTESTIRASMTLLPNGKVLVAGGPAPNGEITANAFLYDPASGTWSQTGSMMTPRQGHSASLLPSGKVLVAGGCERFSCLFGNAPHAGAELYDPATGTWASTTDASTGNPTVMNHPRHLHSATLLDPASGPCGANCGKVLLALGQGTSDFGNAQPSAELFDPATGRFTLTGSSAGSGHVRHAAIRLHDGRVMVLGGLEATFFGNVLDTVEIWDPVTGTWQLDSLLNGPTAFPSATVLPNGKVLVVGSQQYAPSDVAQIWSPDDPGTWRSATSTALSPRRGDVAMAQLPPGPASACGSNCGKVLVAGGRDASTEFPLAGAELYTPRPDVNAIAPAGGPADGGTTVAVTGTGLASATSVRFGAVLADSVTPDPASPDTRLIVVAPAASPGPVDVTATSPGGVSAPGAARYTFAVPVAPTGTGTGGGSSSTTPSSATTQVLSSTVPAIPPGYRLVAADGGIFAFGSAPFLGSTGGLKLNRPVVGQASTPSGRGYWLVAEDGGIFAFGDARFLGSTGAIKLAQNVVGMARTPSGNGYWLVAADGGIFAFGDARFLGSTGALKLNQPIVAMAPTPSGNGYWLVAADGGIFAFGDARFLGSTGAIKLAQQVVGMARTATGNGYWLVAADGGIFAFGDARFLGSTGAIKLAQQVVGMAATATGNGYWLVAKDGGIFAFGDAPFLGSTGAIKLAQPVVGMAPTAG